MNITAITETNREKVKLFFQSHWGSPEMVLSTGIYDCSALDGFIAWNKEGEMIGLITYILRDTECEIISLDSIEEGRGVGTKLLHTVEQTAKQAPCDQVKIITTNDNLLALKFYQKRGYCLAELLKDAVKEARKIKPEIPFLGNDGIPIRDEVVLVKNLSTTK
ncbi:GNAT family N-acetyltransferase [Niallia circulans]|uniref:GNAT family N-acetyltransferase n=1 Tax=Niallia circulans TaxID=1397 RepID=UPI0026EDDEFC|nr:GNAT family N-acetyltransferase [Niallia circulans]